MERIYLDARAVANVARFTTQGANRPNLSRIHLDAAGILVATTGHVLLAWRFPRIDVETKLHLPPAKQKGAAVNFRLPKMLHALVKSPKARVLILDPARAMAEVIHADKFDRWAVAGAVPLDMSDLTKSPDFEADAANPFPNWRQVMPWHADAPTDAERKPCPPFNPELYARFLLSPKWDSATDVYPTLTQGTHHRSALLVTYAATDDVCGVIMPLDEVKCGGPRECPAWVRDSAKQEPAPIEPPTVDPLDAGAADADGAKG